MNKINTKKGFTIIEVVLVLAIAGLIFLMVFIALPALQRNQRDTQRKNDLSRMQSAVNSYQANNRNAVPNDTSTINNLLSGYLRVNGDKFADPSGTDYSITLKASGSATDTAQSAAVNGSFEAGKITYWVNATCRGESVVASTGNAKVALGMRLEGGGVYCLNN
ncbi:MAG: type II secretion system protein [bacterium]|nr:type II secretion system protein [bacterium]